MVHLGACAAHVATHAACGTLSFLLHSPLPSQTFHLHRWTLVTGHPHSGMCDQGPLCPEGVTQGSSILPYTHATLLQTICGDAHAVI